MATGIAVHPTRAAIERRSRWWQPALVVAGIALAGAWLWLLYELSWRAHYDSDHANMVLSGRDFIGNPLLRDWVLPGDPFWLTYIPLFGLAAIFVGTGSTAMHLVYVVVTGAILAAAWWTIGRQHRGPGRWLGAALVALLVGLPHSVLSQYLLTNLHSGTALACLVGASLLVHHPRRPAWWAGVLLLAAAVVSDPFGIVMGVLPVACAGLAATLRQRRWTPVLTATAAALLAGGAAPLVRWALRGAGGFGLAPALPLAPSSSRLDNLRSIPETMGALLGVGPASGLSGVAATARAVGAALFVLGILIAAARLAAGIIRGPSREEAGGSSSSSSAWLDDVLFAGTLGVLATFVVVVLPPRDIGSVRYLIPALILGGLLAGRQLAWVADRLPLRGRAAAGLGVAVLASVYLVTPLSSLDDPEAVNAGQALVPWLAANGLRAGYGPYWTASIVTVESGGSIPVRPVTAVDGRLHGYHYFSTSRWFGAGSRPSRWFVAYDPAHSSWGVDDQTALATFGPPNMIAQHGVYRILIWDKDLSSELGPPYRDPERAFARAPGA